MAADYIINASLPQSGNRYQSFAQLEADAAVQKNLVTRNLGRPLEIEVAADLVETYNWVNWTTDATNSILVYGTSRAIKVKANTDFASIFEAVNKHIRFRDLTLDMNGRNSVRGINGYGGKLIAERCEFIGLTTGAQVGDAAELLFCLSRNCGNGITVNEYCNTIWIVNCTAVKNTVGILINGFSTGLTIINTVSYGNSSSNWSYGGSASYTLARNNGGATGDTIPDNAGGKTVTGLATSDFVDWANDDFHIPSASRLRHTHASYPTGNNQSAKATLDVDGQTLPASYSTDADRWDTGWDFYVLVVVGTTYYIDANVAQASGATAIKRASDNAAFTLADMATQDTLEIRSGAVVHFKDNGSAPYNFLPGIKLSVLNGEFWLENALTTLGQTLLGVKGSKVTVGAQGRFVARGALLQLADLSAGAYSVDKSLDNGEWAAAFGASTQDTGAKYGEPAVLFVGSDSASALPWLNKGSGTTAGDLANDATHGRFFQFNPSTGAITWPDAQPTGTDKVFAYNLMLHSKDGQGTAVQSLGFDVTAGGAVDIQKLYFTGAPDFTDGNGLILSGFGVLQRLKVSHCSGVQMDVFLGISQANEVQELSIVERLKNEAALGSLRVVGTGTVLRLKSLQDCSFTSLWVMGLGAQSSGSYRLSIQGTDGCNFGALTVLDGGVSFDTLISIDPVIGSLTHSNDNSGSNGNNQQHALYVAASGVRGLKVNQTTLAASGQPTALDIFNVTNAGSSRFNAITYAGTVRYLLQADSSFSLMLSGAVVEKFAKQAVSLLNACAGVTVQNVRTTSTQASPAAFEPYSAEDVLFKNAPYENSARYTGWAAPVTDLNFMELSLGAGSTGVLVANFSRSNKGAFALSGLAKSNNSDAVILPGVGDSAILEWPYEVLRGSASPYFQNAAPTVVGTNTGNLTLEYALNADGAGYGTWKALTGANLSAEAITAKFRIKLRVTCATANAANAITQIILATNIDSTVAYPSSLVTVTLRNIVTGSRYLVYRGTDPQDAIASGTASGATVSISGVAFDVDETITVVARKNSSGSARYQPFQGQGLLTESGADIFITQIEDTIAGV